ncbi:hydrogenase expression/formation C-terminal domain-containing protein [Marimonas arenosa]|uniref:Hydrogenase expression/formation protein n=1 Tax=Marimonas arenosa TaxID=1795305 RepID=A0AAE3WB45_9RHOB|nr:hydrogenase expression/formation C-terminal domain-containing protein [Marimonas arenosa]MDQ2089726.1 hydrogenase expression/formation protein [Marimonas arenosa]
MTAEGHPPETSKSAVDELRSHLGTGNARPVLREIETALGALLESGRETTIDLGAIPFGPGDERMLDEVLGPGEVHATIYAMGESHVAETGVPGVWRVDHFDQRGETLSRFIEVTFCPDILKTQTADAEAGLARLTARLAAQDGHQH